MRKIHSKSYQSDTKIVFTFVRLVPVSAHLLVFQNDGH